MPIVRLSRGALSDIVRHRDFNQMHSGIDNTIALLDALENSLSRLSDIPYAGRIYDDDYYELIIPYKPKKSYLALYQYDQKNDIVNIIAIKEGREATYTGF